VATPAEPRFQVAAPSIERVSLAAVLPSQPTLALPSACAWDRAASFLFRFEAAINPQVLAHHIAGLGSDSQPGGNMEGKEARLGIVNSALFATITTDASCGAVNSMHDSFTPIGGLVPLLNILSGEVIFGGGRGRVHRVHGPDAHERHQLERRASPQGRGRFGQVVDFQSGQRDSA